MKRSVRFATLLVLLVTIISSLPLSATYADVTKTHKMEFAIYVEDLELWVVGWMNHIHSEIETPKGIRYHDGFTAHSFLYVDVVGGVPVGDSLGRAVHTTSYSGLTTDGAYKIEENVILKFKGMPAIHMKILVVVQNGEVKVSVNPPA